ncbi:MAG TPA: hypothetical protein VMT27_02045, partial [Actinomycetes bacterium]|nr:hypothetical protein [Actinomycetes bacterium]
MLPTIGIAVALLAGLALPASASTLPDTRYRILSVVLVPRTGDVVVTAKTSCAGKGSMSWDVDLRQGGRHDSG